MKVEQKIATAFVIAFLALGLVGAVAYLDARALLARNAWVVHTYQVLQKIDETFEDLLNAGLGERGFLLSGQDVSLEPYQAGRHALGSNLDQLQWLTNDNPVQQANIVRYRALAKQMTAIMEERIARRKAEGAASLAAFTGADFVEHMDHARAVTREMIAEENRLLVQRTESSVRSAGRTLLNFTLFLGLALLLLLGFYVFIRHDLAARRRAAASVEASDRRFRGVLESAPDAMLISNELGIISLSNSQATRLFGYPPGELAGRTLGSLLLDRAAPVPDRLEGEEDPARVTRGSALIDLQARGALLDGLRRNGERFPMDLSRSPLESGAEHLEITIIRDRTEQQRAEDGLRKFSLDLARSNAELERFAYVASHDLQEPLRMVSSYTQLLAKRYKGKLDANADEFIAYAVDGANRMQKLIADLLALSRVGMQAKESEPVKTGPILQRVLADLRPALEAAGGEVRSPENMPLVLADGTQVGQLFQNILANGLKFHGEAPPRLEVAVTPADGGKFWQFAVKDNGIGIEEKYFERIFIIFQRLHGKETYAGTGIGLAICKKIVERHGGRLWLESELRQGTTFLFTLPAIPA